MSSVEPVFVEVQRTNSREVAEDGEGMNSAGEGCRSGYSVAKRRTQSSTRKRCSGLFPDSSISAKIYGMA